MDGHNPYTWLVMGHAQQTGIYSCWGSDECTSKSRVSGVTSTLKEKNTKRQYLVNFHEIIPYLLYKAIHCYPTGHRFDFLYGTNICTAYN